MVFIADRKRLNKSEITGNNLKQETKQFRRDTFVNGLVEHLNRLVIIIYIYKLLYRNYTRSFRLLSSLSCYFLNGSGLHLIVFKPSEHVCSVVLRSGCFHSFHHESFTRKQPSFINPVVPSKSLLSTRMTGAARLPAQQNSWLKVRKTRQLPGRLACGLFPFVFG